MSSKRLGVEFDLPPAQPGVVRVGPPSRSAYECDACGGIAYNPVCPYCEQVGQYGDTQPVPKDGEPPEQWHA